MDNYFPNILIIKYSGSRKPERRPTRNWKFLQWNCSEKSNNAINRSDTVINSQNIINQVVKTLCILVGRIGLILIGDC